MRTREKQEKFPKKRDGLCRLFPLIQLLYQNYGTGCMLADTAGNGTDEEPLQVGQTTGTHNDGVKLLRFRNFQNLICGAETTADIMLRLNGTNGRQSFFCMV